MRQWTETISYVLTTVFRIIHQQSAIKIGDVKPTYKQEIARVPVQNMQITPIIVPGPVEPAVKSNKESEEEEEDKEVERRTSSNQSSVILPVFIGRNHLDDTVVIQAKF